MGLHLCSLSSFYDSLNSSPGILTESDFSLSYSSPCQPKESDLSLACHFQNRSPELGIIFQGYSQLGIVFLRLGSVRHRFWGLGLVREVERVG